MTPPTTRGCSSSPPPTPSHRTPSNSSMKCPWHIPVYSQQASNPDICPWLPHPACWNPPAWVWTRGTDAPDPKLPEENKLVAQAIWARTTQMVCKWTPTFFLPHIPSPPGSARWAHWSLPVTLQEECKLITTRLSSSQLRTTRVLSPSVQFTSISFISMSDWGPDPDARPLPASQCGSLYPDPFSPTTPVRP